MIISIDRFFEKVYEAHLPGITTFDLMLLGIGKYLMGFLGFSREDQVIVAVDNDLYKLARSLTDVPIHSTLTRIRRRDDADLRALVGVPAGSLPTVG